MRAHPLPEIEKVTNVGRLRSHESEEDEANLAVGATIRTADIDECVVDSVPCRLLHHLSLARVQASEHLDAAIVGERPVVDDRQT